MYLVQKLVLILHSCFGKGLYEPSATFKIQHCAQRIIPHGTADNSTFNTQHSTFKIAIGIPCHTATSEVVVFLNPSAIECFYDKQCNETEMVAIKQKVIRLV